MDLRYWGEAFMYAVHIRNITVTFALKDKVPKHAWTGRKPDILHLRVFGLIGYANIPKAVRGGKLEATSVKCRLLGCLRQPFGVPATEQEVNNAVNEQDETERALIVVDEPRTYREAAQSAYSKQWEEALGIEYRQLRDTRTIEWVKTPLSEAIGSLVVYCAKHDSNGNLAKFKARIVARSCSQVPGRDYNLLFVSLSVFWFTTLCAFMSFVADQDRELHQVDVVGAYLQEDLDEEIYMKVPENIKKPGKEEWCWRLKKALYGLKQSGQQWKKKLDEAMAELGFEKGQADECLYVLKEDGHIVLMVLVYVDDMAVAGKKLALVKRFERNLAEWFDITDGGDLTFILGVQVIQNRQIAPFI
ncbi:hypothetical protein EW026_g7595 [Hermanssonia centrifuga]|uniref:Reverse transcriptase Ty1/copia-type domain-containing protein n=1 Tax=Hermanssonia centrifuga TaxID=98765 RepID=A0A4V3X9D1_9APHY|nr:hypothetical protein EW026_g7595 [Hermanssonia centrifuga]